MDTTKVTARIAAEMILGKIRLGHNQPEPTYLTSLRMNLGQMKRIVGDDFDPWLEENKKLFHVMIDLIFDKLADIERPETIEGLKSLPIPQRTSVELIASKLCGGEGPHHRWQSDLWATRQSLGNIVATSISGLTKKDIREGYHELVHAIIDELWAQRSALTS